MKKIVLLGDSIRMGYQKYVASAFEGIAEVYGPEVNCRYTLHLLRHAHEWQKETTWNGADVDLVQWNAGLWDVLRLYGDEPLTPIEFYKNLIKRIDARLRMLYPNAKMIFATSTNVQEEKYSQKIRRTNADIKAYNAAALEVLSSTDTVINDLYSLTENIPSECRSDVTHYNTEAGVKFLGGKVVAFICKELGIDKKDLALADAIPPEISAQVLGY